MMALGAGVRPGVVFDRAMESTDLVPTIGSMLDFSAALAQGSLSIDPEQHVAAFAGTALRLTAIEFGILRTFLTRPGAVFSRDQIMSAAYQLNIQVSDRTIDSHIRNIRAKLSALNCDNVIETVHGVGFKLGRCEPQP